MKNIIVAAAAAGAGAAAYLGLLPENDPATSDESPASAIERAADAAGETMICLKADLSFLPGDQAGCVAKSEIRRWRDAPLLDPAGGIVEVRLTHPNDPAAAPAQCSTCRAFMEHRYDGWFALSARDMRREALFVRACGVIEMLLRAAPARADYFDEAGLNRDILGRMPARAFLFLGGDRNTASPAAPEIDRIADGRWKISAGGQTGFLQEMARLDFDGDGVAEILSFMLAGPEEATARVAQIALIECDAPGAPATVTPIDFNALVDGVAAQ